MRFLLMLATAASGFACEKDPALSNITNNLSPAAAPAKPKLFDPKLMTGKSLTGNSRVIRSAVAAGHEPALTSKSVSDLRL
jgi:hypothetical protein